MASPREFKVGDLVSSVTGRDRGRCYLVWAVGEDSWLELVDGRTRRVENPKRKNPKHVRSLDHHAAELALKIAAGGYSSNTEVRKVIAEVTAAQEEDYR